MCSRSKVESLWQVCRCSLLLALEGPKISHQERIAGSVGLWAHSQAGGCMTGMSRHLPSEPSLQGLVLLVSGCGETWKAFWLASLL